MQAFSHKYEIFLGIPFTKLLSTKKKSIQKILHKGTELTITFVRKEKNKEIHAHRSHYGNVFRYQNLCILHLQRNVQNSNCRRRRRLQ